MTALTKTQGELLWKSKREHPGVKIRGEFGSPKRESPGGKEVKTSEKKENGIYYYDLAYAVAMAETENCKFWFWKEYNNCFWIKNWKTAPCPRIGRKNMCIYNSPSESYEAFKKIWKTHYKKFPNYDMAVTWTGDDKASIWLADVKFYYNLRQNEKNLK